MWYTNLSRHRGSKGRVWDTNGRKAKARSVAERGERRVGEKSRFREAERGAKIACPFSCGVQRQFPFLSVCLDF